MSESVCVICLQNGEHARLTLRDLSVFYGLCAEAAEDLEDERSWLCTFCWTRVSQCIHFITTARKSRMFLSKKCGLIKPNNLHQYKMMFLPKNNVCTSFACCKLSDAAQTTEPHFEAVTVHTSQSSLVQESVDADLRLAVQRVKDEVLWDIKEENEIDDNNIDDDFRGFDSELEESKNFEGVNADTLETQNEIQRTWQDCLAEEEESAKRQGLELVRLTEEEQLHEIADKKEKMRFKNSKYKCEKCARISNNEQNLQRHMENSHSDSVGPYECNICYIRYKMHVTLTNHKVLEHERRWRCSRCSAVVLRNQWPLHGDRCSLFSDAAYECNFCHKKYNTKRRLGRHKARSHAETPRVQCDICKKTYKHHYQLQEHMRVHTGEKPYECEVCDKKFFSVGYLYQHKKSKHAPPPPAEPPEERYCVECDQYYKTKKILELHLTSSRKHVDPDSFKHACEYCDKKFQIQSLKDLHVKQWHSGSKDHPCPMCGKAFAAERFLQLHIKRTHNKVELPRNYVCDLCGTAFKTKQTLGNHRRAVHEKARPYKCEVCAATFGFHGALFTHNKLKHQGGTRPRKNAASTSKTTRV